MALHGYFRSSAAYRVRIAIALKGLSVEQVPVDLRARGGGEQQTEAYRALNPAGLVPVLVEDGQVLTQSLAIVEYLNEVHPEPPLLPDDALGRARVRALAQSIACDIHPLNNLRVLRYLVRTLGVTEAQKTAWYHHWVQTGLAAFEQQLAASPDTGRFCHANHPTLADLCLVPQVYNARQMECPLDGLPNVLRIYDNCLALPAFQAAQPEKQHDFKK